MKTLDEVIKAQERCGTYPNCHFCFLHAGPLCEWIQDALHYLKAFQGLSKMWNDKLDKEQANPALTWSDLQQMDGKPVWVELLYHHPEQKYKYWDVIKRFDAVEGYDLINLVQTGYLHKSLLNREWQAYRKEHHEN